MVGTTFCVGVIRACRKDDWRKSLAKNHDGLFVWIKCLSVDLRLLYFWYEDLSSRFSEYVFVATFGHLRYQSSNKYLGSRNRQVVILIYNYLLFRRRRSRNNTYMNRQP
jgi:hypothetical protein